MNTPLSTRWRFLEGVAKGNRRSRIFAMAYQTQLVLDAVLQSAPRAEVGVDSKLIQAKVEPLSRAPLRVAAKQE